MKDNFIKAMIKKYEADIDIAKATIEVYLEKPVGIGEHPQFANEIDKQLEIIGCASDKLRVINKHYPTDNDDIPF
mgnify:CR=1 FL=1|tara:strand:- start:28 stop:252 length:225 start_codon:yes stop_codon:yes gene_type:complete